MFKAPTSLRMKLAMAATAMSSISVCYQADKIHADTKKTLAFEATQLVSKAQLSEHNSLDKKIWIQINSQVYDFTDFITEHPGGAAVLNRYAGKDASKLFNRFHAPGVISTEPDSVKLVGQVDETTEVSEPVGSPTETSSPLPKLSSVFNLNDFEAIARKILPDHAWAYYSGGSDDEITLRENHYAYHKYFFLPQVLVDTREVDVSTTMLGCKTSVPFYCLAAALAHLGHPEGELGISKACGKQNVIQMISSSASYTFENILDVALPNQTHWFQLYVKPDRQHAFDKIKTCEQRDVKGIFVTVDTPVLGRREKDFKFRYAEDTPVNDDDPIINYDDPGLTWDDIDSFKRATNIPIAVKGIQRVDDVLKAVDHGVDAVVLSNHGGRQLDFARAPVDVLAELMPILRERKLDDKIEVYVDGGIRRGSDVVKALCLGAKGVGLGRSFLYANSGYGEAGVKKAIQLLKNEVELTMKLLGVTKISDLNPSFIEVNRGSKFHDDSIYDRNYERMSPIPVK